MRASARLVAEARPDGGTRLTALAGQAPLLLRETTSTACPADTAGTAGTAQIHLVGGAAGPLGGDELRCTVDVGPGARLRVRSVAASIVLPGPHGRDSSLEITARVEAGAALSWSPQPLIAARGARHRTTARVDLAEDARLVWREEIILGRHGEEPGSLATRLRVRRAGKVLLDQTLAVGPGHPGSRGPAVAGPDRAAGTIVIVDPAWARAAPGDRLTLAPRDDAHGAIAVLPLPGPAIVVSALAPDGVTLGRLLDAVPAW
ncbi:urease accessory protein [Catenulispora sp. GP43]|uniref:urease accessory protein UreD n=1 Tax=Catenulispora sp. GP43 TaxID=3156263 RepID=UPI003517D240